MINQLRLVVLCGSFGALQPSASLVEALPVDTGLAVAVLTHRRSSGYPMQLAPILSSRTAMPVSEMGHGETIQANHVYVIPAAVEATVSQDEFSLAPMPPSYGWPTTFDVFLRSVARSSRLQGLAVILSGYSNDGTAALEELRQSGGFTAVQSDPVVRSMPDAARRSGMSDYEGTAMELAEYLVWNSSLNPLPIVHAA